MQQPNFNQILENAMETVSLFEPITNYQITTMRNKEGHLGALIDIHLQCEAPIICYLEPQAKAPRPAILAKQILHACGWANVEIVDDDHE